MGDDKKRIEHLSRAENDAIAAGDAERYFALLADDCVMMPPNTAPLSGAALRDWLAQFIASVRVESLRYEDGQTQIAGDWAWHEYACDWRITPRAGGAATTPRFKGMHILRREAGNEWRILRNIWNLDPPRTN